MYHGFTIKFWLDITFLFYSISEILYIHFTISISLSYNLYLSILPSLSIYLSILPVSVSLPLLKLFFFCSYWELGEGRSKPELSGPNLCQNPTKYFQTSSKVSRLLRLFPPAHLTYFTPESDFNVYFFAVALRYFINIHLLH